MGMKAKKGGSAKTEEGTGTGGMWEIGCDLVRKSAVSLEPTWTRGTNQLSAPLAHLQSLSPSLSLPTTDVECVLPWLLLLRDSDFGSQSEHLRPIMNLSGFGFRGRFLF